MAEKLAARPDFAYWVYFGSGNNIAVSGGLQWYDKAGNLHFAHVKREDCTVTRHLICPEAGEAMDASLDIFA